MKFPTIDFTTLAPCVLAFAVLTAPIGAQAQQVWFAPPDNLQRGAKPPTNQDFPQLFDASPAWSAKADAFVISPLMGSVVGPEDALRKTNAFLAGRHIALAVGIGA